MNNNDMHYGEEYYKRCKDKGIDYAYYGNWQKQYAKMVIFVTEVYKVEIANKILLDVGSACGVNLRAFKETGIFAKCIGIDISKYLVELGNKVNKFEKDELIVDDCSSMLHIEDESIDFIHCSQLFEHLKYDSVTKTIVEFHRVMKPGAIAFVTLNAIKDGQTENDVTSQDPTHITVMTERDWSTMFNNFKMKQGIERKMKKANFFPGNDGKNFYEHYCDDWSIFIFTK